jgi:hypothetical protein
VAHDVGRYPDGPVVVAALQHVRDLGSGLRCERAQIEGVDRAAPGPDGGRGGDKGLQVGLPGIAPPVVVGHAQQPCPGRPFAVAHRAPSPPEHRVVGVDRDDGAGKLGPEGLGQAGHEGGAVRARRRQGEDAHSPLPSAHAPDRTSSARRSSTSRCT